jgi:hypothetical protein
MNTIGTFGPAEQEEQRSQLRRAIAGMLVPIFFAIGFAACIIGTYHKPHVNEISFGVVGPAAQTAPLVAAMEQHAGSAFEISQVTTPAEATGAVRSRDLVAAFVPTPDQQHPATVIVAQAGGRLQAAAAESFARAVTATQGQQLVVRDVVPLAAGDAIGLGVFMYLIILTIAGYLAVTVLETAAPGLRPSRRYPLILGGAILTPTLVYLIAGLGYGTYTGSPDTLFAFIGVGALYTLVVGVVTRLFQVLLGPAALFVSLAVFVFFNIPSLGATYTPTMLPSFWRFMNHFWLGAQTVNAERSILYFNADGVGTDLLKFFAWTVVAVVVLVVPAARKYEQQRKQFVPVREVEPVGV